MAVNVATSTPRRSPRLTNKRSSDVSTPVRNKLRACMLAKETSSSIPTSICTAELEEFTLDKLKFFVEQSDEYTSITSEVDIGQDRVQSFLILSRKLKKFDETIGPYDEIKLNVREDGSYKLRVYNNVLEENRITLPFEDSCAVPLQKLADKSWLVCPGVQRYSDYKDRIGYDLKRVIVNHCPPNSVRDQECTILYQQRSCRQRSTLCSKCLSLKWQLSRRKREHEELTPADRASRQSSSSHVPIKLLSPMSQEARISNIRKAKKKLQDKAEYYLERIERLSANEGQNKEIGDLVTAIVGSETGLRKSIVRLIVCKLDLVIN